MRTPQHDWCLLHLFGPTHFPDFITEFTVQLAIIVVGVLNYLIETLVL